jgi:hypothetical protein
MIYKKNPAGFTCGTSALHGEGVSLYRRMSDFGVMAQRKTAVQTTEPFSLIQKSSLPPWPWATAATTFLQCNCSSISGTTGSYRNRPTSVAKSYATGKNKNAVLANRGIVDGKSAVISSLGNAKHAFVPDGFSGLRSLRAAMTMPSGTRNPHYSNNSAADWIAAGIHNFSSQGSGGPSAGGGLRLHELRGHQSDRSTQ